MNKDNEAFAEERRSSTAEIKLAPSEQSPNEDSDKQGDASGAPGQSDKGVNVFDYEVSGFDSNKRQEMSEKRGSAFLGGTQKQSASDDSDKGWNT